MATSNAFNEEVESLIANLLRKEYPHMKTSSVNGIAAQISDYTAMIAAESFQEDCANIRQLDFLDLPRELRDRIYEFVVRSENMVRVGVTDRLCRDCGLYPKMTWQDSDPSQPAITRVSHLLRSETLPLFYKLNEFVGSVETEETGWDSYPVTSHLVFADWLKAIGPKNFKLVRKLVVLCRVDTNPDLPLDRFLKRNGVELANEAHVRLIQHDPSR